MRRLTRPIVAVLIMLSASLAGIVVAAPAQAAANPCYWIVWGDRSNCDGTGPFEDGGTPCNEAFGNYRVIHERNLGPYAMIQLRYYGGGCRVAWATISVHGALPSDSNCYVKVTRNSDGQTYRRGYDPYRDLAFYWLWTAFVYDADVTSYVWGYCRYGPSGPVYTAGTPSY